MPSAKRILLVEDSEGDIELLFSAVELQQLPCEITIVRDGAEALDFMTQRGRFAGQSNNPPALVLLDLKLPKIDGLEVLRRMKGDAVFKRVPIVILTSSREENDLLMSYDLGANAYVVKSMELSRFLDSIKRLVSFWLFVNEPPPLTRSSAP
jgi:CheY-like chemotaxis protein